MIQHILLHFCGKQLGGVTFAGDLHNLKGTLGLQSVMQQIGHNAVTGTDDLRDGTGAVPN